MRVGNKWRTLVVLDILLQAPFHFGCAPGPMGPAGQSVTLLVTPTPVGGPNAYLGQWGGFGNGDGMFNNPSGVAVDSLSNLYVADYYLHRVQKFTSTGAFSLKWGRNGGDGTSGTGNGEFNNPTGLAVDFSGNVYVADSNNNRIQKFTSSGTFLAMWGKNGGDGTPGAGDGEFYYPRGVAVDTSGNIYVADEGNNRVQKFNPNRIFSLKWGKNGGDGTSGTGNGEFINPSGLAVDALSNVFVSDMNNHRIQKFTVSGIYLSKWGKNGGDGTPGTDDREFNSPSGLTVDALGKVYVADTNNHRVQKFNSFGIYLSKWGKNGGDGTSGTGNGEFTQPSGVVVDSLGDVYVAEYGNPRIQKFGP